MPQNYRGRFAATPENVTTLAVANVHGHFKTETHFGSLRLGPHSNLLRAKLCYRIRGKPRRPASNPEVILRSMAIWQQCKYQETLLMIIMKDCKHDFDYPDLRFL